MKIASSKYILLNKVLKLLWFKVSDGMAGLEDLNLKQSFMRQMAKVLSAKKSIIMRKQQN